MAMKIDGAGRITKVAQPRPVRTAHTKAARSDTSAATQSTAASSSSRTRALHATVNGSLAEPQVVPPPMFNFAGGLDAPTAPATPPDAAPQRPPTPPTAQATDAAVAELLAAEAHFDAELARGGDNSPLIDGLARDLHEARAAVRESVAAEIEARTAPAPHPSAYRVPTFDEAAEIVIARYADDPEAQAVVQEVIDELRIDHEVDVIAEHASAASDPATGVERLVALWNGASPEVQARLLEDPRIQALLDEAVEQANAPLDELQNGVAFVDEASGQYSVVSYDEEGNVQSPLLEALENLDELTRGLPPELAAEVVERALPGYERALEERQELEAPLYINRDFDGNDARVLLASSLPHLAAIADRVAAADNGGQLVARLVDAPYEYLTFDPGVNASHEDFVDILGGGTGPALLLELARRDELLVGGASPLSAAVNGIEDYVEGEIATDVETYLELAEQLNFALELRPAFSDEETFEQALDELLTEVIGPDWEADIEQAQAALAEHGEDLLAHLEQLRNLPPEVADPAEVDAAIQAILEDPNAEVAISLALQQNPELAVGERGEALLDLFSSISLGNRGRRIAGAFANLYVQNQVPAIADLSSAADVDQFISQLEGLRDDRLASLLGVRPDRIDEAIDALEEGLPELLDPNAAEDGLRSLDERLRGISGFQEDTLPGQIFRGLGLAASAVSFVNSVGDAIDDPGVQNTLEALASAVGFAQNGAVFTRSLGLVDEASVIGRFGSPTASRAAGRILGAVGAGLEIWNAADSIFGEGDVGRGALHLTSAGGTLLASFAGGPVGVIAGVSIVITSTIGLGLVDRAEHNNRFQQDAHRDFLEASDLSDEAAGVLFDTSGEGFSPLPILLEYGGLRGLSVEETIEWINSIDPDALAVLRDYLHNTLDDLDGDLSGFGETAETDESFIAGVERARHLRIPGPRTPESAVQVDALLQQLDIAPTGA